MQLTDKYPIILPTVFPGWTGSQCIQEDAASESGKYWCWYDRVFISQLYLPMAETINLKISFPSDDEKVVSFLDISLVIWFSIIAIVYVLSLMLILMQLFFSRKICMPL